MDRSNRQQMESVLLRCGYTKMFHTRDKHDRIFYRRFLTEHVKMIIKPNGNDLCHVEYLNKQIKSDGIHIKEMQLTTVDFKSIIDRLDEYERLVLELTKSKN